jgi:ribosome maturation factor RimP
MRETEIADLVAEAVASRGADLVELRLSGPARRPLLRVYVDVPGGTTADACAEISRAVEARLDAERPLGERYVLEVSSPGLDRPLRTAADFRRLEGRAVAVETTGAGGPAERVGTVESVEEAADGSFRVRLRPLGGGDPLEVAGADVTHARAHLGPPRGVRGRPGGGREGGGGGGGRRGRGERRMRKDER